MKKACLLSFILFFSLSIVNSQAVSDLTKSVPLWMEYEESSGESTLKWLGDDLASSYAIYDISYDPISISLIETLAGDITEYPLGVLEKGKKKGYRVLKTNMESVIGVGVITVGVEAEAIHNRGRCLVAIDSLLVQPLESEILRLVSDLEMDGWEVTTMDVPRSLSVVDVKSKIIDWYDADTEMEHSLFLLGHIPVPYSGNFAYDGHNNHQGAWSADSFYADIDGNWTDQFINNITPSRDANKNIPGDGKYDNTTIPSLVEIQVGRADFHNLPAFEDDEIELTRKYLNKNHEFRMGKIDYPRRAIIENNFAGFPEGFGQSAWRNYVPMLGLDSVRTGNYDVEMQSKKYLCSYACGGGSYTSASGIGSTANLWSSKDIQTVFTLNFGSYFGDWDSQNNFLRASLASGDILTNAWAGRPVWHLYPMALGENIGVSAKLTHNASSNIFNQGFGSRSSHIGLMGDPTLRLHTMLPPEDLQINELDGTIELSWTPSDHADDGYFIYRKESDGEWQLISDFLDNIDYMDLCAPVDVNVQYMVKSVRLEQTGSGSYYNTSLGIKNSIMLDANPNLMTFYADLDQDGFGDFEIEYIGCEAIDGFVDNSEDCDDTNADINPDAEEIADNEIDDNCDGIELTTSTSLLDIKALSVYPTPASSWLYINNIDHNNLVYELHSELGIIVKKGGLHEKIYVGNLHPGIYFLNVYSDQNPSISSLKKVVVGI